MSGQAVALPTNISGVDNIHTESNGQWLGSQAALVHSRCASGARLLCNFSVPEHGQPDLASQ